MATAVRYEPVRIEAFTPVITVQPWGTETLIAATPEYTGKVLHYRAGKAGGLQYHVEKDETFYLHSGKATVVFDRGFGLNTVTLLAGDSFHVPAGAVHQFVAVTDCLVFEVSTNVRDDRVRMESHYGVPSVQGAGPTTWDLSGDKPVRLRPPAPDAPDPGLEIGATFARKP